MKCDKQDYKAKQSFLFLWSMLLLFIYWGCQTKNIADISSCLASNSQDISFQEPETLTYYSWENTREFSQLELLAIQNIQFTNYNRIASEAVRNAVNADDPAGYYNNATGLVYNGVPTNQLSQEHLQNENFRVIIPMQEIDGWNLFILAKTFVPESIYMRSFVLMIEGPNGWQSHYFYSVEGFSGGYDLSFTVVDLNHDGRKELLFTSHTGGSGNMVTIEILQIHLAKQGIKSSTKQAAVPQLQLQKLKIPRLHKKQASFQDNFTVMIELKEKKGPILIRRFPIAKEYNLGFDQDGKWTKGDQTPWLYSQPNRVHKQELQCNGRTYDALYIEQPLKGLANFDSIGYFASTWYLRHRSQNEGTGKEQEISPFEWVLLNHKFLPNPGNELVEYQQLLP